MGIENGLSEREVEILQLVATGASNKEIAARLVISPNTVKVHLRNIFAKIGVVSRTEATLYALRSGLIAPGSGDPVRTSAADISADTAVGKPQRPWLSGWRALAMIAALALLGIAAFLVFRPLTGQPGPSAAIDPTLPGRWVTLQPMPVTGSGMAAVSYENRILLIGGQRESGVSGAVSAFDVTGQSWAERAAKPTPVTLAGAALIGEKIYVPGGEGPDGAPTTVLEVYDPRTDRWETAASMPIALSRFAIAALEGNLYVFGGWDGAAYTDMVLQYNAAEDAWQEREPMAAPRADGAAAALGTKIMLVGGANSGGILGDAWAYFPQRETAGENAWEDQASLPLGRSQFSLAALAGSLYLAGGVTADSSTPPVLRYDEAAGRWEELETAPVSFGALPALVASGNFIHIFGGLADDQPQDAHLTYQAIYTVLIPAISR